jgi:hypothetical protein
MEAICHGFTEEQRQRWADSPFCARLLKLHWRSEPPSERDEFRWEAGELKGFEAAAMKEHLAERREILESQRKTLASRQAALSVVSPAGIAEAKARLRLNEEDSDAARTETERLQGLKHQPWGWQNLLERLMVARTGYQRALEVLADVNSTEEAVTRLRELRKALPTLQEIHHLSNLVKQAEALFEWLAGRCEQEKEQLAEKESAMLEDAPEWVRHGLHWPSELPGNPRERLAQARATFGSLVALARQVFALATHFKEWQQIDEQIGQVRASGGRYRPGDPDTAG